MGSVVRLLKLVKRSLLKVKLVLIHKDLCIIVKIVQRSLFFPHSSLWGRVFNHFLNKTQQIKKGY